MNGKKVVIAVRDSAVGAYAMPMVLPSRGVAVRSFTDEVNRQAVDNSLYQHPEDYSLHVLAEWDESTGIFHAPEEGCGTVLVRGKDVIRGSNG